MLDGERQVLVDSVAFRGVEQAFAELGERGEVTSALGFELAQDIDERPSGIRQGFRPIQVSRIRSNKLAIYSEPRLDGKTKCAVLALERAFVKVPASVA